jgi:methyl-accepting chemotaxis protein
MFKDMRVGTRLAFAFGLVVVLLIAVLILATTRMTSINESLRQITEINNEEIRHANGMEVESLSVMHRWSNSRARRFSSTRPSSRCAATSKP